MKRAPLKESRLLLRCLFNSGNAYIYSKKNSVRVKTGATPFPWSFLPWAWAWSFLIIDKARTGDLINGLASLRLSRYSIATAGPFHSLSSSQPLLGYSELPSQSPVEGKKDCYYSLPTSVTPYSCKRRFVHFLAKAQFTTWKWVTINSSLLRPFVPNSLFLVRSYSSQ